MKCIILAAGQGKRIDQVTKNKPKCLIKINKETLLERQIKLLNHLKLKKITIVKGFMAEKIKFKSVDYVYNKKYKTSEQLESFFSAKKKLNEDVLVTFGDIIYELSLVKKLISSKVGDIILATDKNRKKRYKNRYDHPFSQADKVKVDNKLNIINNGKKIDPKKSNGEFLGIFKLTKNGCKTFLKNYLRIKKSKKDKMQIHDFFKYMINRSIKIKACFVNGKFMEIDTMNDLKIAKKIFKK